MDSDRKDKLEKLVEDLKYTRQSVAFIEAEEINKKEMERIATQLSKVALNASPIVTEHKVLKSLYFKTLPPRHTSIVQAHRKTFDWIFNPVLETRTKRRPNIKFMDWLKSDSRIYWVSG